MLVPLGGVLRASQNADNTVEAGAAGADVSSMAGGGVLRASMRAVTQIGGTRRAGGVERGEEIEKSVDDRGGDIEELGAGAECEEVGDALGGRISRGAFRRLLWAFG
jgi:hypothetical protein